MKYSYANGNRGAVFLNGIELRDVVSCDDDAGEVSVLVRGEQGELLTENGAIVERTLYGNVVYVPKGFGL